MKHLKFMLAVVLSMMTFGLWAQNTRTEWTTTAKDLGEGLYEINVTASIPDDLHIYALGELGGYNPTAITIEPTKKVEIVGEVTPSREPHKYYDEVFKMDMGDTRGYDLDVEAFLEWMDRCVAEGK